MRDWVEDGGEFSEEETGLLLEGAPLAELPPGLAQKLADSDLQIFLGELPRNLGALLASHKRS